MAIQPAKAEKILNEPISEVLAQPKGSKKPDAEESKPVVVMTELDSIISESLKTQESSLDDIEVKVLKPEPNGLHRMSLPIFFEEFSYDCTRGETCRTHRRDEKSKIINPGKFIFRWILKDKRSFDHAKNVRNWRFVNRNLFSGAPRNLFSVSGAIEEGDSLLAFMPVAQALELRNYPARRSQDMLRSRITPDKKRPKRVLMTGNPEGENYYQPNLAAEEAEDGEGVAAQPGALEEGRDF